jgi:protein-L-isoaspartate(D-aspartate) O-methyltransferase
MTAGSDGDRSIDERRALVRAIDAQFAATEAWTGRAGLDPRVRNAMLQVPRHLFVSDDARDAAYLDTALQIGFGQTISQPFIVALMTDLLDVGPTDRVLEIGTGSGYQAAVLGLLAGEVLSVEYVAGLATGAAERLARLGYDNVTVQQGDGARGWPALAPYDAIIVTAQSATVPPALLAQLKPGGRLILPLGGSGRQMLTLVTKRPDGRFDQRPVLPVAFVPLV